MLSFCKLEYLKNTQFQCFFWLENVSGAKFYDFSIYCTTEQTKTIFIKARLNNLLLFFNWKSATEKGIQEKLHCFKTGGGEGV